MRFRFIEDRRSDYPVKIMCGVLGVSPAGYCAWRARRAREPPPTVNSSTTSKRVHRDTNGRYGSPRVHAELRAQGRGASRGRIERLMRRHGIRAIMARATDCCAPPTCRHDFPIAPNLPRAQLHRRRAEPDLLAGITYVEDRSGLALSGYSDGSLQPQDRRLGDGSPSWPAMWRRRDASRS